VIGCVLKATMVKDVNTNASAEMEQGKTIFLLFQLFVMNENCGCRIIFYFSQYYFSFFLCISYCLITFSDATRQLVVATVCLDGTAYSATLRVKLEPTVKIV